MLRLYASPVTELYILFFVPRFNSRIPQPEYLFPFLKRYPPVTHSRLLFSLSLSYQVALEIAWCLIYYSDADVVVQVQEVVSEKYDFILLDKPLYDIYSKEYSLTAKAVEMTDELRVALSDIPYTYMLFGKEQEKLAAEVGAALGQLVKDGTSKAINLKYFRDDYSPYDYFNQ